MINRNRTYYLRYSVSIRKENKPAIKQYRFSLQTKLWRDAIHIYYRCHYKICRKMETMKNLNHDLAIDIATSEFLKSEIKKELDIEIQALIDVASKKPKHWETRLQKRKVKKLYSSFMIQTLADNSLLLESKTPVKPSANSPFDESMIRAAMRDVLVSTMEAQQAEKDAAVHKHSKALHELLDTYLTEKKPVLAIRTFEQTASYLGRFIEIVGIEQQSIKIDADMIDDYVSVLKSIMSRFKPSKTRPSKSEELKTYWRELQKLHSSSVKMHSGGLESHFNPVRQFLAWCHARHAIEKDFSSISSLKISKKISSLDTIKRVPFSDQQLGVIFSSYIYSDLRNSGEQPKDYQFWLSLIALTTGARLAEIIGLETQDIYTKDGIDVIDINNKWHSQIHSKNGYSKQKKNDQSIRIIPIPQTLLDAGFLNYIRSVKSSGLVFPSITFGKNKGLGDYASKWFNERFLKYVGIEKLDVAKQTSVAFHSFRHNFSTNLDKTTIADNVLNDSERCFVTGHNQAEVRFNTYSHGGIDLQRIKQFMDKMDHGVDLSHVNFLRFQKRKKFLK